MTATFKSKVRMAQQYQQTVHLKQFACHETLKVLGDCDIPEPDKQSSTRNVPSMITEWKMLPFAFPVTEENQQKAEKINDILMFSLRQQKEDEISNNTEFVTVVVSRCLHSVGVTNQVDCGYRRIAGQSWAHMWLVIDGYIIDNTYIKDFQTQDSDYVCKSTPKCYKSCDFTQPHPAANTYDITSNVMQTRLNFYLKNTDKALALDLNKEHSFNYYFSMIRHMYDTYGVSVTGIDTKIRFLCWWCQAYPTSGRHFLTDVAALCDLNHADTSSKTTWKFQQCSRCMVAVYCSADCQRADWENNHKMTCFSRGSVYLSHLADIPIMSEPLI